MSNLVHCPFCYWQRMAQVEKGAPPFDLEHALKELNRHMPAAHLYEVKVWERLTRALEPRS